MKVPSTEELSRMFAEIEPHDLVPSTFWYNGYAYLKNEKGKWRRQKMSKNYFWKNIMHGIIDLE